MVTWFSQLVLRYGVVINNNVDFCYRTVSPRGSLTATLHRYRLNFRCAVFPAAEITFKGYSRSLAMDHITVVSVKYSYYARTPYTRTNLKSIKKIQMAVQ